MLEGIRQTCGMWIAQFRLRHSREPIISFTRSVTGARHALIVMPIGMTPTMPMASLSETLKKTFREENITVVSADGDGDARMLFPRSRHIRFTKDEISMLFLPSSGLLTRLREHQYDFALDLNIDSVLPSAYICKSSSARVRMGFVRKRGDVFYNFQIQPDPKASRLHAYDRLAKSLLRF